MNIEDLDLSVRCYSCLKFSGINTVEQLTELIKNNEIHKVRHLTARCLEEIKEKINCAFKQTNADCIRAMSDEGLQKFLLDFEAGDIDYAKTFCDICCKDAALEQKSTDCEGCLLWWLKNDSKQPQGLKYWESEVRCENLHSR